MRNEYINDEKICLNLKAIYVDAGPRPWMLVRGHQKRIVDDDKWKKSQLFQQVAFNDTYTYTGGGLDGLQLANSNGQEAEWIIASLQSTMASLGRYAKALPSPVSFIQKKLSHHRIESSSLTRDRPGLATF